VRAVGGSHEGRQVRQFEEATQRPNAGSALLLEDEVEGEQEALEEGEAGRGFKEGDEFGRGVGVALALFPVAQGGVGDAGGTRGVACGLAGAVWVESVVEVARRFGAGIAKRRFRGRRCQGMLVGKHGSCLRFGGAKARVGGRAVLVQGTTPNRRSPL
jgi:hypothetical protein